jgi:ubiquitin carboxyl-terminal hydrolase 47
VLFNAIEESFKAINKPCKINELYEGAMDDYLKCTECGYERNIFSEFLDLSLPIHDPYSNINNSSLEEALENYVKPEVLDEDNKYECSGCNNKVRAVKGHIFDKLPKILIIQLNRFTFNMYGNAVKINEKISFPFVLNMNQLIEEDVQTKILQTEQKLDEEARCQKDAEMDLEIHQDAPLTEDERQAKALEEVNARLDQRIENEKIKEAQAFDSSSFKEAEERQHMGEEDINYEDPMNSIAGPQKVHFYGSPDDEEHEEFGVSGSTGGTKQSIVDKYNGFKRRDEKEILDEIQQQTAKYIQQGEFVYSLYSVLIHSGGVSGGHYSAYIKSFEDDQWYHFNDSTVSEISISDIEEMYGDGKSSKNAYLVIYKKIALKKENETMEVDTDDRRVISDDQIPDYIQDEVKLDNDDYDQEEAIRQEEEAKRKEREAHVTLRLFTKLPASDDQFEGIFSNQVPLDDPRTKIDEKKVDFKNYQTIEEAKHSAYDLFGFKELGVNYEDTQLRFYSVGFKVLKQTFKDHEIDKLNQYGISMATPLFLETKLPNEVFETLDSNTIALRYYLWTDDIKSLDEVDLTRYIIFVNKDSTVMDLQQDIIVNMLESDRLKEGESLDNIAIFKEKYNSGGVELQEVSPPDFYSRTLSSLNIMEG